MKRSILLTVGIAFYAGIASALSIDTTHTFQTSSLALNLDGAAHAYHPNNEGLLHNLNGGITMIEAQQNLFKKNRGYGIAKRRIGKSDQYQAYIRPDGFYVSQTTPYNKSEPDSSSAKYADAETIPYITLSPGWKARGIRNCDIAYVVNLDNGKRSAAIFADYRGNDESTEISLALAQALDIPVTTKKANSYDGKKTVTRYVGIGNRRVKVYYFIKSGDGNGKSAEAIQEQGKKLMGLN